jgi:hypothetical protein
MTTISRAALERRSRLYRRGAPAARAVPAEVAKAASAPTLGASLIREHHEEMQSIAREQTLLYRAAKNSYSRAASEGEK